MRLAVISDIHGNAVALDAVLRDLEGVGPDAVVNLGDAIQGGPQPREVVERLRAMAAPVVMGNADAYLLGLPTSEENFDEARKARLDEVRRWTLGRLGDAERDF